MTRLIKASFRIVRIAIGVLACATAASASDIVPPVIYAVTPTGANLSDGTFVLKDTDLSIGPMSMERFHLSGLHDPIPPFFGPHMSSSFDIYVKITHVTSAPPPPYTQYTQAIVHMGNTATSIYDVVPTVTPWFISPYSDDAHSGSLEWDGSAYIYTDQDGVIYYFGPDVTIQNSGGSVKRVGSITYPDGHRLTFTYDGATTGFLKMVTDSRGYAIVFNYGNVGPSGSPVVTAACAFNLSQTYVTATTSCSGAVLKTSYSYTGGALTGVTDVTGQTTTYGYVGSGFTSEIACIKPPGYATCKISNTYNTFNATQLTKQVLADGSTWNFSVACDPNERFPDFGSFDGSCQTGVAGPAGTGGGYVFTKSSPYAFTDANGKTTQYRYSGGNLYNPYDSAYPTAKGSMLMEATFPEGNKYNATYDMDHYNVRSSQTWTPKPGSGLSPQTESLGFAPCSSPYTRQNCTKPITSMDGKGYVTNFDYYGWGGVKSEMKPSPVPSSSWTGSTPAIDKARPLKLYDYVQKYAYIKNSGGSLVAAATPVWLPNSETLCQTVAGSSVAACDSGAPITVTTYEYGANGTADNLLLRGRVVTSAGVSLRTCYGYDTLNNKISETSPRAGLTSCL